VKVKKPINLKKLKIFIFLFLKAPDKNGRQKQTNQPTMSSIENENTFVMQEWMELCIAEFLPYNKNLHMVSKTFNYVMKNHKHHYASKIQTFWKKHRALSIEEFENASEEQHTYFTEHAIKRFYFVHYPYPDYVIVAALYRTRPYARYFVNGYIGNKRDGFTRREFYDVLKMCDKSDIYTIGY